jgi:CheY-like chemotaxis protein
MLLENRRIFYVEDDLNNRAIVQMVLEQNGAKFAFERWGERQTITKLQAFMPVDLILLDLMLPNRVSGYDVYAAIRAEPQFNDIPVVIVSASDPAIEIPKVRRKGINGYIGKPIDVLTFPQLIARFLEGESAWVVS